MYLQIHRIFGFRLIEIFCGKFLYDLVKLSDRINLSHFLLHTEHPEKVLCIIYTSRVKLQLISAKLNTRHFHDSQKLG